MKSIVWQGSSYRDLLELPADARREAGFQLDKVQRGQQPDDWKPMNTVGPGVREIRISDHSGAYRIIYVAEKGDCIYVFHAFKKKTQKTPRHELQLARDHYRAIADN